MQYITPGGVCSGSRDDEPSFPRAHVHESKAGQERVADTSTGRPLATRVVMVATKRERNRKDEAMPERGEPLAPPDDRQVPPQIAAPTL